MAPDENESLKRFPPGWTASMIGEFMLDSPSAAVLVSMFSCLWGEPVSKKMGSHEDMMRLIESETCALAVESLTETLTVPPCPFKLMEALGLQMHGTAQKQTGDVQES